MSSSIGETDSRIAFFGDLLSCQTRYYLWALSPAGDLMNTNCRDLVLDTVFTHSGCRDYLLSYASSAVRPLMLSSPSGLVWVAVFERRDAQLSRIHLLGPYFTSLPTCQDPVEEMRDTEIPASVLRECIRRIPTASIAQIYAQAVMLHFCVTGEKISTSDILFQKELSRQTDLLSSSPADVMTVSHDRARLYMAERAMMDLIRTGTMSNSRQMLQLTMESSKEGTQSLQASPLIRMKISHIIFSAICSRAAMEGGVPPDTGYDLCDSYIRDIMNAETISEISAIGRKMYEEFILLVHRRQSGPKWSAPVTACCDYIEAHLGEHLSISVLASRIGYTDYYLSRKFRKETGMSVNNYIKSARVRRAKMLLSDTQMNIQSISDSLGFPNRNFFSETFRHVTGMPPGAYRSKNRKL
jgi:AraC-like DNA-binding protein